MTDKEPESLATILVWALVFAVFVVLVVHGQSLLYNATKPSP